MSLFVYTGILFPFMMTALGAAIVFFFGRCVGIRARRICLGFASGVMAAATAFSLLVPARMMMHTGAWCVLPAAFLLGAAAVGGFDALACRTQYARKQGEEARREMTFLAAITLHNIPEGMAVGLTFAAMLSGSGTLAAACAAALGIGLQNLPEGAAVALPMRQGGMSRRRSFLLGAASGAVEPVAAAIMIACSPWLAPLLPALMAFAAGTMMAVALCEIAPAAASARDGAIASMIGFALMMAMDMGLG